MRGEWQVPAGRRTLGRVELRRLTTGVVLVLATVAVYAGVSYHEFLSYDDTIYVVDNPYVNTGLSWDGVRWALTGVRLDNWHPLTWISHMLDVEWFGLDAGAHKWTSVLAHALSGVLLYVWLGGLTGAWGRSAFVAGVFALHPLHVESVAWIAERKDVLSGCFAMLTLLCWTGWARRRSARAYAGALAFFAAGLLSKSMLVTLPCVLLLLDLWPLGRLDRARPREIARLVMEKLPFFVLAAGASLATLTLQSPRELQLGVRVDNALVSYVRYLRRAFWPTDLATMIPLPESWPLAAVVGAAVLLLAISAGCLWQVRQRPFLLVGWLWFVGMLVPVIGLIQVGNQAIADRYTYLPLIGLSIAVAWGVHDAARLRRVADPWLAAFSAVLLVAWAVASRDQVATWRDQRSVFARSLAVTERNAYAHTAYGIGFLMVGRLGEAIEQHHEALAIEPSAWTHTNLGQALLLAGDAEGGAHHFKLARRLNPELERLDLWTAAALEAAGRVSEAVPYYEAELDRSPGSLTALRRLASLRLTEPAVRDREQAVEFARRASAVTGERNPRDLDLLAAALAATGLTAEAIQIAELAVARAQLEGSRSLARDISKRLRSYQSPPQAPDG